MSMLERILRRAFQPPVNEMSGYKTFVDPKSEKNLKVPEEDPQTRNPQDLPQSREKERPLPIPSDHNPGRDKIIGPTVYNKPDSTGGPSPRTKSIPGEQNGNPSKDDYGYVRRRKDVTGKKNRVTFPSKRQRETKGPEQQGIKQDYLRHRPSKQREMRQEYRTKGKNDPDLKRYKKLYEQYPKRFERKRPGEFDTAADRTKAWREEQKQDADRAGRTPTEQEKVRKREEAQKRATEQGWYTTTKETVPPGRLDQNFHDTPKGAPRRDKGPQEGESLRAPNLDTKSQKGLSRTQIEPKPDAGIRRPTVQSPGDGSGKVIPQSGDFVNHTQVLPDRTPKFAPGMDNAKVGSLQRIVALYLRA